MPKRVDFTVDDASRDAAELAFRAVPGGGGIVARGTFDAARSDGGVERVSVAAPLAGVFSAAERAVLVPLLAAALERMRALGELQP